MSVNQIDSVSKTVSNDIIDEAIVFYKAVVT